MSENLQIFRIEHQLQLARLCRPTLEPILEPLGLKKLGVGRKFHLVRYGSGSPRATRATPSGMG